MSAKDILETYKDQTDLNRDGYAGGAPDHYAEILRDALYTLQEELLALAENWGNGKDLIDPDKVRSFIALNDLKPSDPEANSRPSKSPELNQLIYTQVLELIGSDVTPKLEDGGYGEYTYCTVCDMIPSDYDERTCNCTVQNQLRAELRAKLKAKYIGGEGKSNG